MQKFDKLKEWLKMNKHKTGNSGNTKKDLFNLEALFIEDLINHPYAKNIED